MQRQLFSTNTPWEPKVGYARAVRAGPLIHVSGTTATNSDGEVVGQGDAGAQMRQCLENIRTALEGLGSRLEDVTRTRIYVTNIRDWEAVGAVHGKYFATIRPATAMVEVSALIDPSMLVEVEAEAWAGEQA